MSAKPSEVKLTSCGVESIEMNITINTLIELKKLQFHVPQVNKKSKCHLMHIGKSNGVCPDMKVHGHTVDRVSQAVYLGDVISQDGSNTSRINDRLANWPRVWGRLRPVNKMLIRKMLDALN